MVISHPIQQKKSSTPLLWVAILGIIFMLGSAIAVIGNNRPTPPQFGAGMDLSQDATRMIQLTPTMQSTPTPLIESPMDGYMPVVTFYVPVSSGETIREDMLTIVYWQADRVPSGSFRWIEDVVGRVAITDIPRFMPVLDTLLVTTGSPEDPLYNYPPLYMYPTQIIDVTDIAESISIQPTPTATHTFIPTPRP